MVTVKPVRLKSDLMDNPIKQHQVAIAYHLCRRIHALAYMCRDVGHPIVMAELGIFEAFTSEYLLSLFPKLQLVMVDTYMTAGAIAVAGRFGTRARFIRNTTLGAAAEILESSLDLVFIDAQHTYENVKEDIHEWAPKLKDEGIMGGHYSFDPAFPGVRKAVEETGLEYEAGPGHTWWFKQCPKGKLQGRE